MKLLHGLVGGVVLGAVAGLPRAEGAEPVWNIRDKPLERVSVVAHRGAGDLAPENTMEALELSWSMGCIPELDVRTTKDGHLMMFHDKNFARIMPHAPPEMKKKRLEDLTYAEAKQLDVGAFRGPQFAGQRIVSLAEICAALKKDRRRAAYIDVKNVDFAKMARETAGVHEQIVLATGSEADCAAWKAVAPRSEAFLWVGTWGDTNDVNVEKRFARLREINFAHIDRLQVHCHFNTNNNRMVPSDDFIRRAGVEVRARGIEFQTMPWNVPQLEAAYTRLLDLGTEGFGTDRPDVALRALRAYYRNGPPDWNVRDHIPRARFTVQAHRGAGDLAPEGSKEAFELGWKLGCIPEADWRETRDGVIVSFHDNNFARILPNAPEELKKKGVADLTFAEVKELDVGSFRNQQFAGQRVISLAEMVGILKAHPERSLYIDIKKVDFHKLAAATAEVHPQLILASTKYDEIKLWREVAPKSRTLHWMGGPAAWMSGPPDAPNGPQAKLAQRLQALREVNFAGIDQLQIHVNTSPEGVFYPSEDFLREAGRELRAHGILFQTLPWKQKDAKVFHRLMDLGCASFATDYPDAAQAAVSDYYRAR
ncbi:MAG TPA: glycerophosphodiester phosphodiesterase family protein [Verrucomicrobiota bacterium]|nr:glycerophosphodiester phosphodiesterase family protein [Verrucomicrobiota bacterium]